MEKKQKLWAIGGTAVVVALLIGGGVWWWLAHDDTTQPKRVATTSQADSQSNELGKDSSSSLAVNGGTSLGQLNQTNDTKDSSSASSDIDPTTLAQYDKYKNGSEAMFAEIKAGNGTQLVIGMKAAVTYTGYLTNGQVFDSTNRNGKQQPFIFTLGSHEVIPGFEQGVAGMKVGGKRLVIIPPAVGYGAQAQSGIPANSLLIFVIELQTAQ
jgi:FKBP-type peptidyl-prolyl cis-trans isomerase